jgi:phosphonate transport system substrate-binding protein
LLPFLRKLSRASGFFGPFLALLFFCTPSLAYSPKKLKIGLVPSENSQELMRKAQPLVTLMRTALGMEVEACAASDYTSVVEAMRAGKIDAAFFAPGGFVLAEKQAGARVILKSIRKGKSFFYSAIITHRDSGINKLEDLKGKSFAFVDLASVSGAIYPKSLLLSEGINPERDFSRVIYAGGHDATVLAVLHRRVDAGATFANDTSGHSGAWTDFLKNKEDQDQIKVIAYSEPAPADNLCVSRDLDKKVVDRIRKFFLDLSKTPKGSQFLRELYHIDGYAEATSADYEPVRKAFERVGFKIR